MGRRDYDKQIIKVVYSTGIFVAFLCCVGIIKSIAPYNDGLQSQFHHSEGTHSEAFAWNSRSLLQAKRSECRDVHNYDISQSCEFVSNAPACKMVEGFINYIDVIYCKFPNNLIPLGMVILFIWWMFIFIGLAITADDFFCPDLAVISDTLGLSPNVAGVTFLAFGNGAADIFSAFAAFQATSGGDAGLAVGGLFGAGVFVTTIVAGSIALVAPFTAMQRPLLRDIIFYLAALYWTFYIFYRGEIFLWEAIGFMVMYVLYVIVVVLSQKTYDEQQDSRRRSMMSGVEMKGHRPSIQLEKIDDAAVVNVPEVESKSTISKVEGEVVNAYGVGSLRLVLTPLDLDPSSIDGNTNPAFKPDDAKIESKEEKAEYMQIDVNANSEKTDVQYETSNLEKGIFTVGDKTENGKLQKETDDGTSEKDEKIVEAVSKDPNEDLKNNESVRKIVRQTSQVSFNLDAMNTEGMQEGTYKRRYSLATEISVIEDLEKRRIKEEEAKLVVENPIKEFLYALSPIRIDAWSEMRWFIKAYEVFKSPIQLLLNATIPCVSYAEKNNNWNRHVSCLNCVLAPSLPILGFKLYGTMLGGVFPLLVLTLLIGIALAALVFFTSRNEKPPKYHWAFAFLGFVVAIVWIYVMANEIVNVLKMFGVVLNISDAILGLTLLAWGNSVADFIADMSMARMGRQRTGFTACFGGTLFNLLLGVGVPFTLRVAREGRVFLTYSMQQIILTAAMAGSLLITFVSMPLIFNFKVGRAYGIVMVVFYVAFLIIAILAEAGVIKGELRRI
ncbi:unnamed protein product [Owenia fusiformis]|uniref:Uncharacterized protein n=1 Tax=Owenia fusiformis TaxID=6347 RepID=A0A8J1XVU6_OWEFU|nr:unnamed protein product [Owenia fusiformis]